MISGGTLESTIFIMRLGVGVGVLEVTERDSFGITEDDSEIEANVIC